jgi:hypothetical protein
MNAKERHYFECARQGVRTEVGHYEIGLAREVCDGCKVLGRRGRLRASRECYIDPLWQTVPVLRRADSGRVYLIMFSYCPSCWAKLMWAMLREGKPYFNGVLDVNRTLFSYGFGV